MTTAEAKVFTSLVRELTKNPVRIVIPPKCSVATSNAGVARASDVMSPTRRERRWHKRPRAEVD